MRHITVEQADELGRFCAALLAGPPQWIFRRRESVTVLDEATIRRQQSVDFSLDHIRTLDEYKGVCDLVFGEGLCSAPLFILDKNPGSALSFDLEDESGRTLSLMTTEENARVSAATLRVLCREKLKRAHLTLPDGLAFLLDQLAISDTTDGREWLERLERPMPGDNWRAEAEHLLHGGDDAGQMKWWLETLAVASIVVVSFEASDNHRRVIKIAYEEPVKRQPGWLAKLAIRSFRVWSVSSLISSDRYLFDVTAPPDFRLTRVLLLDAKAERPLRESGFRRRAQLYIDDIRDARGAYAIFFLRVSGRGVLGGALVAAAVALIAIIACIVFRKQIIEQTGGNTGLLLVLPGIVATYVARSDQHGLTTRLLAVPRWILLGCGVTAYYAAGALTLIGRVDENLGGEDRTHAVDHLMSQVFWLLLPAAAIAGIGTFLIFLGWLCTRETFHRFLGSVGRTLHLCLHPRFRLERHIPVRVEAVWSHLKQEVESLNPAFQDQHVERNEEPTPEYVISGRKGAISWTHGLELKPVPTGTSVNWLYQVSGPKLIRPLLLPLVLWERRAARARLDAFESANVF